MKDKESILTILFHQKVSGIGQATTHHIMILSVRKQYNYSQ